MRLRKTCGYYYLQPYRSSLVVLVYILFCPYWLYDWKITSRSVLPERYKKKVDLVPGTYGVDHVSPRRGGQSTWSCATKHFQNNPSFEFGSLPKHDPQARFQPMKSSCIVLIKVTLMINMTLVSQQETNFTHPNYFSNNSDFGPLNVSRASLTVSQKNTPLYAFFRSRMYTCPPPYKSPANQKYPQRCV